MKRLILLAAAAASVAAAMPSGGALARDRDHGRSEARDWAQRDRGDGRSDRRGRWQDERPRPQSSQAPTRERTYDEDRARRFSDDDRRRERSAPAEAPPARMLRAPTPAPRRGGYLPDTYRGAVVDDYRAYRLRPPPRGFAWVRVGSGFALVDMADGRVYDMVQ